MESGQQQRKVFITPKTGAEWKGNSVPGSGSVKEKPLSRNSGSGEGS